MLLCTSNKKSLFFLFFFHFGSTFSSIFCCLSSNTSMSSISTVMYFKDRIETDGAAILDAVQSHYLFVARINLTPIR